MKSRRFESSDLKKFEELHKKYYSEFEFPNFMDMVNAFVIENDEGEMIMAGAIESVGEVVLVTDKEKPLVSIGRALVEAKAISEFTARYRGIKELYAFVSNEDYAKHLIQHGFSRHKHIPLRMRVS